MAEMAEIFVGVSLSAISFISVGIILFLLAWGERGVVDLVDYSLRGLPLNS